MPNNRFINGLPMVGCYRKMLPVGAFPALNLQAIVTKSTGDRSPSNFIESAIYISRIGFALCGCKRQDWVISEKFGANVF